jgi:hypothetical protein
MPSGHSEALITRVSKQGRRATIAEAISGLISRLILITKINNQSQKIEFHKLTSCPSGLRYPQIQLYGIQTEAGRSG